MMPEVSIIVPIYNGSSYVKKIIYDLHNQSFSSVEFLLLDDGSTDETTTIIEENLKILNDSRFKVIKKENSGVSDTRNLGISVSKGRFLIFVDSDDSIPKYFIESYYTKIYQNKTDIEFFPFNISDEADIEKYVGKQISYQNIHSEDIITSEKVLELILNFTLPGYPFGYISKKSLWEHSKFPVDIHFTEDLYALVDILTNNSVKAHINNDKYYNYVQRNSSIMHNAGEKEEITSDIVTDRIIKLLKLRSNNENLVKQATNFSLGHYIVHCENAIIRGNTKLFLNYRKVLWPKFLKSKMSLKSRVNKFIKISILFFPNHLLLKQILKSKRRFTNQEPIQ